jgi:hypothetical protein
MNAVPLNNLTNTFYHIFQLTLLKSSEKEPVEGTMSNTEIYFELEEESHIICKNCGNIITTLESMISVNDRHKHTFSNPTGIVFAIGCFSTADGCIIVGEPTTDFTWFDSYRWSHAICSNCLFHMGWFYDSGSESFFGLILNNLLETDRTH